MIGNIADTSQRRGKNTEIFTTVNMDPVSLAFGLGTSEQQVQPSFQRERITILGKKNLGQLLV